MKPPIALFLPQRTRWQNFPDVLIQASESATKQHPFYAAAKTGQREAALNLVKDLVTASALQQISRQIGASKTTVVAVQAVEGEGVNVIPAALAAWIAERLRLPLDRQIVQANYVGRTGSGGYYRLAVQPVFDGIVEPGATYLMVDDFIGQGATLANLKGHIENYGGHVIFATALTGKPYSAKLALNEATLQQLRKQHGTLESWWRAYFGYGFEHLTESEARYLIRSKDADIIRDRILA